MGRYLILALLAAGTAHADPAELKFQNPGTQAYTQLRTPWGVVAAPCAGGATCSVIIDAPIGRQTVTAQATADGSTWSATSNALVKLIPPAPAQCLSQASCRFDADLDGSVNGTDFGAFVAAFGKSWLP